VARRGVEKSLDAARTSAYATSSANVLGMAMAALAQTLVLGMTIAAIPLTMGIAALQSLGGPGDRR
jgi:hypothetical protein